MTSALTTRMALRRPTTSAGYRRQRGFNLVELLVAMTVAVFLLGGMFSILQSTRSTSTQQTALSQLQDNERFAFTVLTEMVESAGFFPTLATDGVTLNTLTGSLLADGTNIAAGQGLYGGSNGAGGDMILSRFVSNPNDGLASCLGHTNTGTTATTFKNTLQVDSTSNALTCSDANGVQAVPLVTGVVQMTVLWGVNTTATTNNSNCPADTYFTTAQMVTNATATNWTNVCTVKITLQFINPMYQPTPGIPPTPGQPHYIYMTKLITVMGKAGPVISSFT